MIIFASILISSSLAISGNNIAFADTVIATIAINSPDTGAGNYLYDVGVNPSTNKIYVANHGGFGGQGGAVYVIDGATNSVTGTIPVGGGIQGIGVNPNTNKIYVTSNGFSSPSYRFSCSSTVSVIDGATNSITSTIPVGTCPGAVAVNPNTNKIYVIDDNGLQVIDGTTNSVVNTITVGKFPSAVAINRNTNMIYVANTGDNTTSVINGETNSVVSTITVGNEPNGIGVNPKTNMIYVANFLSVAGTVSVIDGATNSVTSTIQVGNGPIGVDANPTTNKIYVANSNGNTVSVIDGTTNSVLSTLPVGSGPHGIGINPNTNMIYVGNYYGKSVSAISDSSSPPTAPQPPTGLKATTVSPSQINLSWTAPTNTGGSAVTGYKIERSTDGGTTWNTIVASTSHSWYSDYFLSASTTYTYRVSAINAIGTSLPSSTASATTSPATIPDPPRYLTPTVVSPSQINLSWWKPVNSGGSAITGYKIESSTDGGTTWNIIVANTGSALYINHYYNTGLLPSTTYTYRVSTINAIGTSLPSTTASATTSSAT